jgi:parallel beta-helix repeat protein
MRRTALTALALLGLALPALAGPLDPPAGPISPTGKTLASVEPRTAVSAENTPGDASSHFVISKPGSYYLTGNLKVSKTYGVVIISPDVSLDLNGFLISADGPGAQGGIWCYSDGQNLYPRVSIRNGNVAGAFGDVGVRLDGELSLVENVAISGVADTGLSLGYHSRALRCRVGNCQVGISASLGTTIESCDISDCTAYGVSIGEGRVIGCTISLNAIGVYSYAASEIRDCLLRYNASGSGAGILLGGVGARVDGNNILGSWNGIQLGASATDNLVTRNTIRKGGGLSSITMAGQPANSFPNNHVAAILADPASTFASTNPFANIQH